MLLENKNPKKITSIFKNAPLLAIVLTAISISLLISYLEFLDFSKRAKEIESEYISQEKNLIKREVVKVTDYIKLKRSQTRQKVKDRIKSRVYEAHAIASNIFAKFNGKLPTGEVKNLIIEALRPMRFFDGDGYYYISSLDGVFQLHALQPDIEGKNNILFQDSSGHYIVKELSALVKQSGEGFLSYRYGAFSNREKDMSKIAFVKYYEPYNWFIGTGDYPDNVEKEMQKEILKYIEKITFGKNSYIFVVNYKGIVLMNASQKHLIGKNIWNLEDPNGVKVIQEERKAVENPQGDYIYYVWNKPSTSTPSPKISFMKGVKDWQWMIGAGIYVDDAEKIIQEQRSTLQGELIRQTMLIFAISLFVSLAIIYVANRYSRKLSGEISMFLQFFKGLSVTHKKISVGSLYYCELRELAISANRMLDKQKEIEDERMKAEQSLRASEASLKEAQRITHFGSWEFDIATKQLTWSDEVYRMFELDPKDGKISYDKFIECVHPDDRGLVKNGYSESVQNTTPYDIEHRIKLSDGKIKRVREHAETSYADDGEPVRTTGTVQDVTELRAKEEQLKRSQKMDALGKLTGGIAHDYNNMLGIIIGYSELLLEDLPGDSVEAKYAKSILSAGERGRALTGKLMTFSRCKSSENEIVDISAEITKHQHMLEKTLTARIQLQLDLIQNVWPVELDSGDLNDAVINMAINSSHAIEGNGVLRITTRNISVNRTDANALDLQAGDYVVLAIRDTGTGMDGETMSKIFDPFYSTKEDKGTGLGLSQVYGFMQRSGGSIRVESELGQGTEFLLYFPCHKIAAINTEKSTSSISVTGGSETILVVDDEPLLCSMAKKILVSQGYHVFTAESAGQALRVLAEKRVDLLFSDVIMPDMDGYRLAAEVRKKYPGIAIQLVSGFDGAVNNKVIDNVLKSNILQKPYTSSELLKRIRELMDNKPG